MWKSVRSKLSFANVMVVVLTFIVLGGGAYAATSLPRNSVGTKQLKNGAVTQKKIDKKVLKQFASPIGSGPMGPPGPRGATGPAGSTEAVPPGGTIAVGTTLRGAASSTEVTTSAGPSSTGTGISFGGFQLPSRPLVHVIPIGGPAPASCPGSAAAPEAASGHLCIYLVETVPANGQVIVLDPGDPGLSGINLNLETAKTTTFADGTVARFGFHFGYSQSSLNGPQIRGTWAATG